MPEPVQITLTTDFGTVDGWVGAMKGVIASRAPAAVIHDITHDIPRHDVSAAAFALAQMAPHFPDGTIHVVVVDPGVGSARAAVIACDGRQRFVGPDNGVLSLAAPAPSAAFAIERPAFTRAEISTTFHGRDVFAPAAAALAAGARPEDAGPPVTLAGSLPGAGTGPRVIHVDRFGNLMTSVLRAEIPAETRVRVGGREVPLLTTYADVDRGQLVAYVGSAGTLEVAVREGSAADALGAGRGTPIAFEPG